MIESKHIAATETIKKALWFRGLLNELNDLSDNVIVYFNSQSAIDMCKNPVFHEHAKYVDVSLHFIRDVASQNLRKCI